MNCWQNWQRYIQPSPQEIWCGEGNQTGLRQPPQEEWLRQPNQWLRQPKEKQGPIMVKNQVMSGNASGQPWEDFWSTQSHTKMGPPNNEFRQWLPSDGLWRAPIGKVCPGSNQLWNNCNVSLNCPQKPFFLGLRKNIHWWKENTQNPEVLSLITKGVNLDYQPPSQLSKHVCKRNKEETQMAWETIQEYMEVGALKEIPTHMAKHLIPWFVVKKGEKLRLITNCKEINHFLNPKPFRLENWSEIFPFLRKGIWAAKIDLKHAYFHLGLAEALKPYMCIQVEEKVFQFQAACFGLNTLPQQWQSIMKVFLKKWRKQSFLTWVYLDDILLVGNSPQMVQKHLNIMLSDLEKAGMVINQKKSQLSPSQQIEHLGFMVDLKHGQLQVPQAKLKNVQKELGKLITHPTITCRRVAAILGSTRSFLMAMPFLRAFTDQLVQFVNQQENHGWDVKLEIPINLKNQVQEIAHLLISWKGRTFQGKAKVRELHSDSSQKAWAGVDITSGKIVQEFWRDKRILHINVKELEAAINTVQSLALPGEHICLKVDNAVTFA